VAPCSGCFEDLDSVAVAVAAVGLGPISLG